MLARYRSHFSASGHQYETIHSAPSYAFHPSGPRLFRQSARGVPIWRRLFPGNLCHRVVVRPPQTVQFILDELHHLLLRQYEELVGLVGWDVGKDKLSTFVDADTPGGRRRGIRTLPSQPVRPSRRSIRSARSPRAASHYSPTSTTRCGSKSGLGSWGT